MNRILRGAVVLAASALFVGCNTEPDEVGGGDPTDLFVNPGTVFVDRDDSTAVLIRVIDQQGTALNESITISNISAGLNISIDSLFRPVFDPATGTLVADTRNTELRIFVKGVALEAGSFTVSGGGLSEDVDVTVTPTSITPVLSTATPNIAEPFTITPEAGLIFTDATSLRDAAGNLAAVTLAVAEDGSSGTFLAIPGFAGDISITNVVPTYAPSLQVTLPSTVSFATSATVGAGFTGIESAATAPLMNVLTPANVSGIVDVGTTYPGVDTGAGGDGVRFYKLVVEEAGHYDFTLTYDGGKDLGVYLYDEAGGFLDGIADSHGNGASASPEEGDIELEAGTYVIGIVLYDYGVEVPPEYFTLTITEHVE